MIECGCCHMYMGEMEEALRLWNQIEQIIREAPESYYSKNGRLEMYHISCEVLQGHEGKNFKAYSRSSGANCQTGNVFEVNHG